MRIKEQETHLTLQEHDDDDDDDKEPKFICDYIRGILRGEIVIHLQFSNLILVAKNFKATGMW